MTIYFDNCLAACAKATIDLPDGTSLSDGIAAARAQWGEGRMIRYRSTKELVWCKGEDDGDWRGCCADKVNRSNTTP